MTKSREPTRPVYGCQVTVQTESEKKLSKLYRKEEKKLSKKLEGDQEQNNKAGGFDAQVWRAER